MCFAQRQKFDKQNPELLLFFSFFVFAIGVLYCFSRASFERRKKVGDVFFLFAIEIFL